MRLAMLYVDETPTTRVSRDHGRGEKCFECSSAECSEVFETPDLYTLHANGDSRRSRATQPVRPSSRLRRTRPISASWWSSMRTGPGRHDRKDRQDGNRSLGELDYPSDTMRCRTSCSVISRSMNRLTFLEKPELLLDSQQPRFQLLCLRHGFIIVPGAKRLNLCEILPTLNAHPGLPQCCLDRALFVTSGRDIRGKPSSTHPGIMDREPATRFHVRNGRGRAAFGRARRRQHRILDSVPDFLLACPGPVRAYRQRNGAGESVGPGWGTVQVVGMYCSKTRGPLAMNGAEQELFQLLCPETSANRFVDQTEYRTPP